MSQRRASLWRWLAEKYRHPLICTIRVDAVLRSFSRCSFRSLLFRVPRSLHSVRAPVNARQPYFGAEEGGVGMSVARPNAPRKNQAKLK
jgi:hypothetical protein